MKGLLVVLFGVRMGRAHAQRAEQTRGGGRVLAPMRTGKSRRVRMRRRGRHTHADRNTCAARAL